MMLTKMDFFPTVSLLLEGEELLQKLERILSSKYTSNVKDNNKERSIHDSFNFIICYFVLKVFKVAV